MSTLFTVETYVTEPGEYPRDTLLDLPEAALRLRAEDIREGLASEGFGAGWCDAPLAQWDENGDLVITFAFSEKETEK